MSHIQQAFKPKTTFAGNNPFQTLIDQYELLQEQKLNNDPSVWTRLDAAVIQRHQIDKQVNFLVIRQFIDKPVSVILDYCKENNLELQHYGKHLNKEVNTRLFSILDGLPLGLVEEPHLSKIQKEFGMNRRQVYLRVRAYRIKHKRDLFVSLSSKI